MDVGHRRLCCLYLLLIFVIRCSARNTISFADGEGIMTMGMEGRSLRVNVDDYSKTGANTRNDPRNRVRGGSSHNHRRRN